MVPVFRSEKQIRSLLNEKSNPADAEVDADCLGVPPEYAAAQCY
jgi:hypothetical protein